MRFVEITEAYFDTQTVNDETFEGDVEIFKNPSTIEFGKLMHEFGFLRGSLDTSRGDVYVWRGDCLHHVIEVPGECLVIITTHAIEFHFNAKTQEQLAARGIKDIGSWLKDFPRLRNLIARRSIHIGSR